MSLRVVACKNTMFRWLTILAILLGGDMRAHPQANLEELGGWLLANPVSSKNPVRQLHHGVGFFRAKRHLPICPRKGT